MRYVVFASMVLGALVAILSVSQGLLSAGGHGITVIVCGLIPAALAAISAIPQRPYARWAGAISIVAFLLAGLKTRGMDSLAGIMVAAFVGILVSIALTIKPYRPAAA